MKVAGRHKAYTVLDANEVRDKLRDLNVEDRIEELILQKYEMNLWTGFLFLRAGILSWDISVVYYNHIKCDKIIKNNRRIFI